MLVSNAEVMVGVKGWKPAVHVPTVDGSWRPSMPAVFNDIETPRLSVRIVCKPFDWGDDDG